MAAENPFTRSDFVHVTNEAGGPDGLRLLEFPGGFRLYTHTSTGETELIYNETIVQEEYLRFGLNLNGAQCVLDVGANIGMFTLFAKKCNPDAAVYAIEPIPETFAVLQANVALHQLQDVYVLQAAVGDRDRELTKLVFYPNMAGNSTSDPRIKSKQYDFLVAAFGQQRADGSSKARNVL